MTQRRWVTLAAIGFALIVLALIVVALVLVDKERFGSLVGREFLMVITSGVLVGAVLVLVGAWMLPARWGWRRWTLIVWAIIALVSPWFGFMFLIPWGVLALMLPAVMSILLGLRRAS